MTTVPLFPHVQLKASKAITANLIQSHFQQFQFQSRFSTIEFQLVETKIDTIDNKINIERLSVLRTPQTNFPPYPHDNWLETYNYLKSEINEIEFDVALLSCGCYGHPLCSYIYSTLNKSAFYIGGRLQLCFGILGSRWIKRPEVEPFINAHWTFPTENETPKNFREIEYGCYWK